MAMERLVDRANAAFIVIVFNFVVVVGDENSMMLICIVKFLLLKMLVCRRCRFCFATVL